MKKSVKSLSIAALLVAPLISRAQFGGIRRLIEVAGDLVRLLIILVSSIALLAFLWGLAKFIFKVGGDEKAVDQGKALMKWGLIALFVMVSVWGIIGFIQKELGLPNTAAPSTNNYSTPNPVSGPPSTLPGTQLPIPSSPF